MHHIAGFIKKYNWAFLAGLLVIHFIVKDRFGIISTVFYAAPLPLIIAFSCVCLYIDRGDKKLLTGLGIVTLALTVYWLATSYKIQGDQNVPQKSLKVMLWNIGYPDNHPNSKLIHYINQTSADIVGIIELGDMTNRAMEEYRSALQNYSIHSFGREMMILTKGKIRSFHYQNISYHSKYNDIEIKLNEKIYHVIMSDIISNPFASREKPIQTILDVPQSSERVIIMGDFNTPYDSVFFDGYKRRLQNAFRRAGSGFSETWPYGIPLLQLDHIWTSPDLKPLRVTKHYDLMSDHALLVADFDTDK